MSYSDNDYRYYELYHHGILGMRWGKKNGPPYPLDSADHSASEKKAGWRKSLSSDSKKESFDIRNSKRSDSRSAESARKLSNYSKSVDLSDKRARYKLTKKYAKELNRQDTQRAYSNTMRQLERNSAIFYRNKAAQKLIKNPDSKKVDKLLDKAEKNALNAEEYKRASEAGRERMNQLIKEANDMGLIIAYKEGLRATVYNGVDQYYDSGYFFKAQKTPKNLEKYNEQAKKAHMTENLSERNKREKKELDRTEEAENYVADRYKQLKKTMSANEATRKVEQEAKKKYPDVYAPDEEIYPEVLYKR